jgi:hypothetical protein
MIWLFLILSIGLNCFLAWYVFNMLRLNVLVYESVRLIKERIVSYGNHLDKINSMETYYGDTTIQSMVDHTKQIVENLDEFLQSMEAGEDEQ